MGTLAFSGRIGSGVFTSGHVDSTIVAHWSRTSHRGGLETAPHRLAPSLTKTARPSDAAIRFSLGLLNVAIAVGGAKGQYVARNIGVSELMFSVLQNATADILA